MSEHFRAFSFVDQIAPARTPSHIEGRYIIPAGLASFPPSLAAEAVGQLAAWAAMASTHFERRPIAGLAGKIDLAATALPGQVLELTADVESLDDEAIAYHGCAAVDGTLIIHLEDCVGPMIPVTDLDDPNALRARFEVLCGPGATPGGFHGLPPLVWERTGAEPGSWMKADFAVPTFAALFADHFPRRPVFPGSLLVQVSLDLASTLAGEVPPPPLCRWRLKSVMDVKLREFIPPGQKLELEARLKPGTSDCASVMIRVRAGQEIAGSTRLLLVAERSL